MVGPIGSINLSGNGFTELILKSWSLLKSKAHFANIHISTPQGINKRNSLIPISTIFPPQKNEVEQCPEV